MKVTLHFQSEQEFQNFFGQLSSEEIPGFQAVEGSGGDKGFDGLSGTVAYQVYYPEQKNRTTKKFIKKIDDDLDKVIKSKKGLSFEITDWILVVPVDLGIDVIAHLKKKSKETGIQCLYWGATKLVSLVTKYPHIQDAFPTIFLPPVRKGIKDIQEVLSSRQRPKVLTSVDIIGDKEYKELREIIIDEYKSKTKSFMVSHGTSSSAYLVADRKFKEESDTKLKELRIKKEKSDKAFKLECDDVSDYYEEEKEKTREKFARRGLYGGIVNRAIGKIEVQKKRAIEKLKLKYGKE